jgi:hypothetical protein
MKDTVSHYIPPPNPLTSTAPQPLSNNLTMPEKQRRGNGIGIRVRRHAEDPAQVVIGIETDRGTADTTVRGPVVSEPQTSASKARDMPMGLWRGGGRRPVGAENERRHWHSLRSTRSLTILGSDTHQSSPTVRNVIPDVGDRLSFAVRTNHSAAVCKSLSGTLLAGGVHVFRACAIPPSGEGLVDSAARLRRRCWCCFRCA